MLAEKVLVLKNNFDVYVKTLSKFTKQDKNNLGLS